MTIEQKLNKEIAVIFERNGGKGRTKDHRSVTYSQLFSDKMLMIDLIKRGIPYSFFELIQTVTPFSEGDWSVVLDISQKSLQRYKQGSKTFRPIQSEKIIGMAEVTALGESVFGDKEKFRSWLNAESLALGRVKPIELLQSSYGKDIVIRELINIEHGIFA